MSTLKLPFGNQPSGPSPRTRRLQSDHERLRDLADKSSIFSFKIPEPRLPHSPPESYRIRFDAVGLRIAKDRRGTHVVRGSQHEILIQLIAEYPRSAPHMRWLTPIFHPNISEAGAICLGGWGTNWAPSLHLDKLCEMLWDMARFANYDTRSPFNRQAAQWLREQRQYPLPLDHRELRDLIAPTVAPTPPRTATPRDHSVDPDTANRRRPPSLDSGNGDQIIFEARLVSPATHRPPQQSTPGTDEILFLD